MATCFLYRTPNTKHSFDWVFVLDKIGDEEMLKTVLGNEHHRFNQKYSGLQMTKSLMYMEVI